MGHPAEPFQIIQHDRLPIFRAQLELEEDGEPLNLGSASTLASQVRFLMRVSGAPTLILNNQATILNASLGVVGYVWGPGETAIAGWFQGRMRVHYAAGASVLQTIPNATGPAGWKPIVIAPAV